MTGEPMNRREFVADGVALAAASTIVPSRLVKAPAAESSTAKGRTLTMEAKPSRVTFHTTKTAIVVVDMQNDFGSKGGMFDRAGIDISIIQKAVAPTARVLAAGRKAGIKIVYLKMAYLPDLSDLGSLTSPNRRVHQEVMHVGTTVRAPNGSDSRILVRDTWNTDIVSELTPEPADTVIYKSRFSGFYKTDLDDQLRRIGAQHLIFTGCTTSVCVESTMRDAMFRDYSPVLLEDCTAEPVGNNLPRSNHAASLLLIQLMFGWVSSSQDFISAISATAPPA